MKNKTVIIGGSDVGIIAGLRIRELDKNSDFTFISNKILGCQILGDINAEISKRIDIVASAIHSEKTVETFIQMDLSYTRPLSSPWDHVQMAAQIWLNKIYNQNAPK
ncbi:hypothetical protein KA977_13630 [Candidatus Dependentiae bacterium]|nr:hypothetical protein [Candidatus Dependentiae bacterium]